LDGHFAHEGSGVEPIDHLWAGSGVSRKLESVDAGAIEQPTLGSTVLSIELFLQLGLSSGVRMGASSKAQPYAQPAV